MDALDGEAPPRPKAELRKLYLERRLSLGPEAEELGRRAQLFLVGSDAFRRAACLMVYLPFRGEVPTDLIIQRALAAGKTVAAPVTVKEVRRLVPFRLTDRPEPQLRRGAYGIAEPDPARCQAVAPRSLDLVVVPGVAFDAEGGRLGYGGGYYDRFLTTEAPQAVRSALAYEVQVSEQPLPLETSDARMDFIFTERRVLAARRVR